MLCNCGGNRGKGYQGSPMILIVFGEVGCASSERMKTKFLLAEQVNSLCLEDRPDTVY